MPQVFQQTLWVGGTDAEGEGQEVAYATTWEEGPGAKGLGPFPLRASMPFPSLPSPRCFGGGVSNDDYGGRFT